MTSILDKLANIDSEIKWDEVKVLGHFLIALIAIGSIIRMIRDAYISNGLIYQYFQILSIHPEVSVVGVFVFGIYLGLLVLLWADIRNRWQAALLSIVTTFGLGILYHQSLLPEVRIITVLSLCGGFSLGFILGGGKALFEPDSDLEFSNVGNIFYFTFAIVVIVMYLESHLIYDSPLVISGTDLALVTPSFGGVEFENLIIDTASVIVGIVGFWNYLSYEGRKKNIALFGPTASGKTALLLGLFHTTHQEQRNWPTYPSEELLKSYNDRLVEGEWPRQTPEASHHSFHYWQGNVFPRNICLRSLDYPGEELVALFRWEGFDQLRERVQQYDGHGVDEDIFTEGTSELVTAHSFLGPSVDDVRVDIALSLEKADTIIFVLDAGMFLVNPGELFAQPELYFEPSEWLPAYKNIAEQYPNTEILLVATKTDYLLHEFEDTGEFNYERFKRWVNQEFFVPERIDSHDTLQWLRERSQSDIHPVFYRVEEPSFPRGMNDLQKPIEVVGFKELLESL